MKKYIIILLFAICTQAQTYSVSAWVNFTTWNSGVERYIFGMTTGTIYKNTSNNLVASSGTIYLDGVPYVNGTALVGWHQVTVSGITLSGTSFNIGASITPGSYFQGFIDKAGIYNGTLSANQVLKLYNDQKARYGL